jgi:hypothetical protein
MATWSTSSIKDINNIIIPFFEKYPIIGHKAYDFQDFCKVLNLMKDGLHLTPEG